MLDPSKPIRPDSAYHKLKSTIKAAGLPDIRFHDFRHTFASHAFHYGMDVKTLASTIGHESVETTLNVCAHTEQECEQKLSELIQEMKAELGITD